MALDQAYGDISTGGINFLDRWIADNVPETAKADAVWMNSRAVRRRKGFVDQAREIDEEVDSLYRTLVDAVVHFDVGAE